MRTLFTGCSLFCWLCFAQRFSFSLWRCFLASRLGSGGIGPFAGVTLINQRIGECRRMSRVAMWKTFGRRKEPKWFVLALFHW